MISKTKDRRLSWIFLSILLFFGIFATPTTGLIPSHIPQSAAARAIGARTSLASVRHKASASASSQSAPSTAPVQVFLAVALFLQLRQAKLTQAFRVAPQIVSIARRSVTRPSLLFRPPPAILLA